MPVKPTVKGIDFQTLHAGEQSQAFRNVLFIDDDYVNYLYFSEMLIRDGFRVFPAVSLSQVIGKLAGDESIALLIITSGFAAQFNYRLQNYIRQKHPELPQIAIMESKTSEYGMKRMRASSDMCIHKQTDGDQLTEAITYLINDLKYVRQSQ